MATWERYVLAVLRGGLEGLSLDPVDRARVLVTLEEHRKAWGVEGTSALQASTGIKVPEAELVPRDEAEVQRLAAAALGKLPLARQRRLQEVADELTQEDVDRPQALCGELGVHLINGVSRDEELKDVLVRAAKGVVLGLGFGPGTEVAEGRFTLLERVGGGAFGTVWKARDREADEPLALKLIHARVAPDQEAQERLLGAIQPVNELSHEGLVRLRAGGRDEALEVAWLAWDLAPGVSMELVLAKEAPLAPARAARLGAQVLEALAAAHEAGLVHGDVKPRNLLVAGSGADERARLADLGMYRGVEAARAEPGTPPPGNPAYWAPEQARGEEAGPPSDVYSVCSVLYEALSKQRPIVPRAGASDPQAAFLEALAGGAARRLDAPGAAPALVEAVMSGLAAQAEERPTAAALAATLAGLAGGAASASPAPEPPTRLESPPPRAGTPPAPLVRPGRLQISVAGDPDESSDEATMGWSEEEPLPAEEPVRPARRASAVVNARPSAPVETDELASLAVAGAATREERKAASGGSSPALRREPASGVTRPPESGSRERPRPAAAGGPSSLRLVVISLLVAGVVLGGGWYWLRQDPTLVANLPVPGTGDPVGPGPTTPTGGPATQPGQGAGPGVGAAAGGVQLVALQPAEALVTSESTVTIRGRIQPVAADAQVLVDGAPLPLEPDGSFSVIRTLAAGRNRISILVRGGGAEQTRRLELVRDQAPPRLEVLEPAQGSAAIDGQVAIRCQVEDESDVTVEVDGQRLERGAGGYTGRLTLGARGEQELTFVARDAVGHETVVRRKVAAELPLLVVRFESPLPQAVLTSGDVTVRGRVTKDDLVALGDLRLTVDGQPVQLQADGAFSSGLQLGEGRHDLNATLRWREASVGTQRTIYVDSRPPGLQLVSPLQAQGNTTTDDRLVVRGRVDDVSPWVDVTIGTRRIRVYTSQDPSFSWEWPLALGQNEVTLAAVDKAGHRIEPIQLQMLRKVPGPAWYQELYLTRSRAELPPFPLPEGLSPGASPGEYVWARDGSVLVWLPPGTYQRGSDGQSPLEAPAHAVRLPRGCFLGKQELSWGQWARFCAATRRRPPRPEFAIGDEHPVHGISWEDAQAYCAWAGLRLPSEAEWEYAARGAQSLPWPWGQAAPDGTRANLLGRGDGFEFGSPAGAFPRGTSPFGCLDMSGNLAEWVQDWFAPYPRVGALEDPRGPAAGREKVLRGGAWFDAPWAARPSFRAHAPPGWRSDGVGLRVAR